MHRSHLRMEAREAFAAEEWKTAEKLLNSYLRQDPDSEEDFVRLAQVYRHFGDTGEEMRCWYRASTLNPLKPEYWDEYTRCAMRARDFAHLYTTLARKGLNAELTPKDRMMYLISAVRTNHVRDAEQFYARMLKEEEEKTGKKEEAGEIFRQDDLGRFAEFLVTGHKLSSGEQASFLEQGMASDDPVVRLESTLLHLIGLEFSGGDPDSIFEQEETILKQAIELNRYAVTPILANVYFVQLKFDSVIELAEPYLEDIDSIALAILYAESCVYNSQPEKLKPLAARYRDLGRKYHSLASYFDALYDFSQGLEKNDDLARHMQEVSGAIQTDLVNLINLQIALNSDNMEKVCGSLETILKNPPFYNIQERAATAVRHYLWNKVQNDPACADDPRALKIAQLLSGEEKTDPFLMRITVADLHRKNMLTRQILQENLDAFPLDPYLLEVAAEFELFNGSPEQCLEYVERFYELNDEGRSNTFDLLHMLALELTGRIDQAAKEYTALVENNEMDRRLLYRYLRFCIDHQRKDELSKMADRLDASDVPDLKALAPFFRAEALLLQEKKEEALALLETAETDIPDFALRAANLLSSNDLLDQALSRYLALVGKHPDKRLVFANIAEAYLAKGMKAEALSYAKQAWEADQNDQVGQFVYAKMLAANGQYQEAEKLLKIPNRKVELPDMVRDLWAECMHRAIEKNIADQKYLQAEEQCKHLLVILPDDEFGKGSLEKVREFLRPKKDTVQTQPGDDESVPGNAD